VPLWCYPRLLRATPEQRNNSQIPPVGDALHWPDIDEDLDVRTQHLLCHGRSRCCPDGTGIDPSSGAASAARRRTCPLRRDTAKRRFDLHQMSHITVAASSLDGLARRGTATVRPAGSMPNHSFVQSGGNGHEEDARSHERPSGRHVRGGADLGPKPKSACRSAGAGGAGCDRQDHQCPRPGRNYANRQHVLPGVHAFHIHAVGRCDPPDFKTVDEHYNPTGRQHGLLNPEGMHVGDLLNLHMPVGEAQHFEVLAPGATLGSGDRSLLDADGSALVIHENADDYRTDPKGNAGGAIACGVIERPKSE
jgi:hypothetical protein